MFSEVIDGEHKSQDVSEDGTAGQKLKAIFRQEDRFANIEEQSASESLLMKSLRLSVFIHLCRNPCDHTRSIARKFGGSLSSVKWNLDRLAGKGYLETRMLDGRKVYWPSGMVEEADIAAVSILRRPWATDILKSILDAGGSLRERDIVAVADASQQTVGFRLGKMVSAGLLEMIYKGPAKFYWPAPGFIDRIQYYDTRSKLFSDDLLAILKEDGLMPLRLRFRGTRLSVEVGLPGGRQAIHLECSPLAAAGRLMRPRM